VALSQQVKEAKAELTRLIDNADHITADEIESYFSRYGVIANNIELMKKEKMTIDIALLLTLAEQKGLS
jgi:hypothetical protein